MNSNFDTATKKYVNPIEDGTYTFYFKTVQSNPIKVLLDSLKDILDDTVIH